MDILSGIARNYRLVGHKIARGVWGRAPQKKKNCLTVIIAYSTELSESLVSSTLALLVVTPPTRLSTTLKECELPTSSRSLRLEGFLCGERDCADGSLFPRPTQKRFCVGLGTRLVFCLVPRVSIGLSACSGKSGNELVCCDQVEVQCSARAHVYGGPRVHLRLC